MVEHSFWFKTAVIVVSLSAVVFLFGALGRIWGFLGDLFLIFFLAYLVGSLLIHTVNGLMRVPHMSRPLAVILVYLAFITLLANFAFLVVPATVNQVIDLAEVVPGYVEQVPDFLGSAERFIARAGITIDLQNQFQIDSLGNFATTAAQVVTDNAIRIVQNVVSTVFAVSLVLVISFYIVLDGGRRLHEALKVLPPTAERETRFVLSTIDATFHGYIRGMLLVSLIYGVGTAAVMFLTGLPAALPVALVSSVLLAVPFIGDWLALALPLTVAAVAGDFITFIIVLGALLFVQQVMLNLLTPRILGHAVRMPAMLVIIAVVLGARMAGIAGALLGVPTMGVIYALSVYYGTRIRERREERETTSRAKPGRQRKNPGTKDNPQVAAKAETANDDSVHPSSSSSPSDAEFEQQLRRALDSAND